MSVLLIVFFFCINIIRIYFAGGWESEKLPTYKETIMMNQTRQTDATEKNFVDEEAVNCPYTEEERGKKQADSSMDWTGNPGSKPTRDYVSMKALVCPDAQWVGTDVLDFVSTEEYRKNNITSMFTMPDGRIGVCIFRCPSIDMDTPLDMLLGFNEIAFSSSFTLTLSVIITFFGIPES